MESTVPLLSLGPAGLPVVMANGFRFALQEATASGTVICVVLLVLSCFAWAVMITKLRMLGRARRESKRFLRAFRQTAGPLQLYGEETKYAGAPLHSVYLAGCKEVAFQLLGSPEVDGTFGVRLKGAGKLAPTQMEGVDTALERGVGEMVLRLESQMALLATTVSGAPFLGLLGTVWGVMDTFGGVAAAEGAASLKTMAPGVSAALVTTVVGLLVAIPAMFGYNMLVNSIKKMVSELDNFAAEFSGTVRRRHLAHPAVERTPATPGAAAVGEAAGSSAPPARQAPGGGGGADEKPDAGLGGLFAPST